MNEVIDIFSFVFDLYLTYTLKFHVLKIFLISQARFRIESCLYMSWKDRRVGWYSQ